MNGTNHYRRCSSTWDKVAAIAVLALFSNSLATRTAISASASSPFVHQVPICIHAHGTCILFSCSVGDELPEALVHLRVLFSISPHLYPMLCGAVISPGAQSQSYVWFSFDENKHVNQGAVVKGHSTLAEEGRPDSHQLPFHDKSSFPSFQATRLCHSPVCATHPFVPLTRLCHSSYAHLNMRLHTFCSNALDTLLSLPGIQFSLPTPALD
jgi:hypothetical protein